MYALLLLLFLLQLKEHFTQDYPSSLYSNAASPSESSKFLTPIETDFPEENFKKAEKIDGTGRLAHPDRDWSLDSKHDSSTSDYNPPPLPTSRVSASEGKCIYDANLWRVEPQTAIANAVMFERKTGISCEDCLQNCVNRQDENSPWVCRSLTYDNRWKICDLYAVVGSLYPRYPIVFSGRDYFEYLAARKPSAADVVVVKKDPKETAKKKPPIRASGFPIVPNGPILPLGTKLIPFKKSSYLINPLKPSKTKTDSSGSKIKQEKPLETLEPINASLRKVVTESCAEGEMTRFALILGVERTTQAGKTQFTDLKTVSECANACDKDELFICISATVTGSGCLLSSSPVDHALPQEFAPSSQSAYLEKVCLEKALAERTSLLWPTFRNQVLIGHVLEVADAETLDECQTACLRAEQDYGFICRSGMWYPSDDDQNCLLNAESRYTARDAFVPEEPNVQMLYFDVPREGALRKDESAGRYKDEPLEDYQSSKYTKWSKCSTKANSAQIRYLKCKDRKDVRKCPKETKPCGC